MSEHEFGFNDLSEKSNKVSFLVLAFISKTENPDSSALSDFYKNNTPKKTVLDLEIKLWNRIWPSSNFGNLNKSG